MKQIKVEMKWQGHKMEINRQYFAMALKIWRLRQGLSQAQVGERWGCSRYTIIATDGTRHVSHEFELSKEHATLSKAISYLEAKWYGILMDGFESI